MAKVKSSLIHASIKKQDIDVCMRLAQAQIKKIGDLGQRMATIETYKRIDSLGTIPVLTGALKSQGKPVVKNKYPKKNSFSYLMGWTIPYAEVRYFGIGQETESIVVGQRWKKGRNGKEYLVNINRTIPLGIHGTPFWDYPITRKNSVMVSIYQAAFSKAMKVIETQSQNTIYVGGSSRGPNDEEVIEGLGFD